MRNDDDEFFAGELFEGIEDLRARLGIERARRLVAHDDLGLFDERPRDGDTLLLPARKRIGLTVVIALHVYHFEEFFDVFPIARPSLQFEGKGDVLPHRQFV